MCRESFLGEYFLFSSSSFSISGCERKVSWIFPFFFFYSFLFFFFSLKQAWRDGGCPITLLFFFSFSFSFFFFLLSFALFASAMALAKWQKRTGGCSLFGKCSRACLAQKTTFGLSSLIQFQMLCGRAAWYFPNTAWPYFYVLFPPELFVPRFGDDDVTDTGMT